MLMVYHCSETVSQENNWKGVDTLKKKRKPVYFESHLGDKCTRNTFVYKSFSIPLKKAKLPSATFASFERVMRTYNIDCLSTAFCHCMMPISSSHFLSFLREYLLGCFHVQKEFLYKNAEKKKKFPTKWSRLKMLTRNQAVLKLFVSYDHSLARWPKHIWCLKIYSLPTNMAPSLICSRENESVAILMAEEGCCYFPTTWTQGGATAPVTSTDSPLSPLSPTWVMVDGCNVAGLPDIFFKQI